MTDPDLAEKALASYVALRIDDVAIRQGCVGWIDSKDRTCQRTPLDGSLLCKRHRNIALRREQAARVKQKQQRAERDQYRREKLPEWKAELVSIESAMDHYGSPATSDRAAYGGATHPSIRRKQMQALSDTNVKRMRKLSDRWQRLTELIGDDQ